MKYEITKLLRTVRTDGVGEASRKVLRHVSTVGSNLLSGTPGYYEVNMSLLARKYDECAVITPTMVSPAEIKYVTGSCHPRERGHLDYTPYFKPREAKWDAVRFEEEVPYGTTKPGTWDRLESRFEQLTMYRGVEQRYVDERDWDETDYYLDLRDRFVQNGWPRDDAETLAMERCDRLELLHQRISSDGYQSQKALNGHPLHEVTVNVSRDGELLYNCEGRHRLSIAKVLDVEEIPVLILVVHDKYDGSLGARTAGTAADG